MKTIFQLPGLFSLSGHPVTGYNCEEAGSNWCGDGGGDNNTCYSGGGSNNDCYNGSGTNNGCESGSGDIEILG